MAAKFMFTFLAAAVVLCTSADEITQPLDVTPMEEGRDGEPQPSGEPQQSSEYMKVILSSATMTCRDSCSMLNMECDEYLQKHLNKRLDACLHYIEYSDIPGNFIEGVKDHTYMMFPTGCYATYRWSTYRVSINTNSYGTDHWGCDAPAASLSLAYRVCACGSD